MGRGSKSGKTSEEIVRSIDELGATGLSGREAAA